MPNASTGCRYSSKSQVNAQCARICQPYRRAAPITPRSRRRFRWSTGARCSSKLAPGCRKCNTLSRLIKASANGIPGQAGGIAPYRGTFPRAHGGGSGQTASTPWGRSGAFGIFNKGATFNAQTTNLFRRVA